MIARYDGKCKFSKNTKCGGVKAGEDVVHEGRGNTYHAKCKVNDFTIEFSDEYKWWSVYEFGVFPRSSVLAGQTMKSFRDSFDTEEEAVKAYPHAKVGYRDPMNTFHHLPGEDDYTEGGYNDPNEHDW